MDAEELVALMLGASERLKEGASPAVRDAYQGLNGLVRTRLARRPEVQVLLEEADGPMPEARKAALRTALAAAGAADDAEIVDAARRLLDLLARQAVDARDSQGVVIGDYNTVIQNYFAQAPGNLSALIRSAQFQAYVDRRTQGFTGRGFAFEAIQRWLHDPSFPAGCIVVQGEPGVGKTALLAQLVKQRGYVHHFNIARMNLTSVQAFLSNVCAQLIVRYGLDYDALPEDADKDGGVLLRLLGEAASHPDNRPVVVVLDALDEAEDSGARRNPLFLPPALPDGVFVIASTRRTRRTTLDVEPQHTIDLDAGMIDSAEDPRAWEDAPAYIRHRLESDGETMRENVSAWGVPENRFVAELTARSEGNFMYLVLVLNDIRDGLLTADNVGRVENLPQGLRRYYSSHWGMMRSRDHDRFRRFEEPVVCLLGTADYPVSVSQVMDWARRVWTTKGWDLGDLDRSAVLDVIHKWWEFFDPVNAQGEERYALYHKSFRDFLAEEVGLSDYRDAILDVAFAKIPGLRRS